MATILSSSLTGNQSDCPYLESLGLRHSPFVDNNESLVFLDERGGQHLNLAIHLLESSHMIVIVLGESGMGKSTLACQLQLRLPDTILPCLISAKSLTPQSLLRSMAGRLDIPQDVDLPTQRLLLAENTVSLRHQDSVPLIIVDDAHLLDDATLDALLQIHTGTDQDYNRWELALFSSHGLEKRVATQLPTGKENIYEIQLKPYNVAQTRDYLANRLKSAGYVSDDLPFTDRQFKLLLEQSRGIPARINEAAHAMLCSRSNTVITSKSTEASKTSPADKKHYPAIKLQRILLVLAIGLITGILLFQDEINQLFEDKQEVISSSAPAQVSPTPERNVRSDNKPAIPRIKSPVHASDTTVVSPTSPEPVAKKPDPKPDTHASETSPFITVKKTDVPRLTLPKSVHHDVPPATQTPEQQPTSKTPVVVSKLKPEPPAPPAVTPTKPVVHPSNTVQHSANSKAGLDWVMTRDPKHYTLQLLATADEAQIQGYINKFELQNHSYYYPIHFRGRLLYVLLTGDFADRASGQAAREQLPAGILKDKPWLRALSLIQAEIKRGHK